MNHIALVLRDIHFGRKSGRVVYRKGDIQKYFFFEQGTLIQIKTNQPDERLGEVLYKLERISREQFLGIDHYIEPNRNLGEVLVSKGLIQTQDLQDALVYQMREAALNTFASFDGELTFQEKGGFATASDAPRINIPFLIEYGIRRMAYDQRLRAFLTRRTFTPLKKTFVYLLTQDEKEVLEKIETGDPPDRVQAALRLAPETFWKALYLLYCLGLVDARTVPEDRPTGAEAADAETPESRLAEILALKDSLGHKSHYELLGLAREAGETDIRRAYFQLARKYHPDRFDRPFLESHSAQIDEVFNAITTAYRTLSQPEKKRAYDASLTSPASGDAQDSVARAEVKFRQGKTLYQQGRYDDAVVFLEEAVRLRKSKADYFILLAMAESRIPGYVKKAEEDFQKAIEMESWNPEGYVGLGLLYKNEGLITKAVRQFEKALSVDEDHEGAKAELARLREGDRKKGLKGLLSMDLFGSKKKPKP